MQFSHLFFPLSLEIQDRPVLSFTKSTIHNAHKLGGCVSTQYPRLRKKWALLEVVGWSVHLRNPVSYLRTYIVYICIFKPPLISLFPRDFFSHRTQPCYRLQYGRLETTNVFPTQNISRRLELGFLAYGMDIPCPYLGSKAPLKKKKKSTAKDIIGNWNLNMWRF